eukprot:787921_1
MARTKQNYFNREHQIESLAQTQSEAKSSELPNKFAPMEVLATACSKKSGSSDSSLGSIPLHFVDGTMDNGKTHILDQRKILQQPRSSLNEAIEFTRNPTTTHSIPVVSYTPFSIAAPDVHTTARTSTEVAPTSMFMANTPPAGPSIGKNICEHQVIVYVMPQPHYTFIMHQNDQELQQTQIQNTLRNFEAIQKNAMCTAPSPAPNNPMQE